MPDELIEKIKKIGSEIVLLDVSIEDYNTIVPKVVGYLTNEKHLPGVYVSLNKPVTVLHEMLEKENVNTDMIVFIDAISKFSDVSMKKSDNCFYLRSPQNLSDVSIAISEAVKSINTSKKFVLIDSLNTFLLYSDENVVARFFHFVIGKIRSFGAGCIIISLKKGVDQKLITELSQFCDEYITV